jgi:hypothetical protein
MVTEQTSYEKVLEEHRELRQMVQEMRHFLARPEPESTDKDAYIWAGDLAERLVRLHRKLFPHFREEDRSGVLEELAERFPWVERNAQALQDEHDQLLNEVRAIVADTMISVEDKLPTEIDLRSRTLRLLDRLTHHEEAETDLIQRVHYEDMGGGC